MADEQGTAGPSLTSPGAIRYAVHALEVWAGWAIAQYPRGYPSQSSEARALQVAREGLRTDGVARRVPQPEKPEAPPWPRETRGPARRRIPPTDPARLGPAVHRQLLDLEELGYSDTARLLRARGLFPTVPVRRLAGWVSVSVERPRVLLDAGLAWLGWRLRLERRA